MVTLVASEPPGDLIWSNVGAGGEREGRLDTETGRDKQTALGIKKSQTPLFAVYQIKSDPESPLPWEPLSWSSARIREFVGRKTGVGSPAAPLGTWFPLAVSQDICPTHLPKAYLVLGLKVLCPGIPSVLGKLGWWVTFPTSITQVHRVTISLGGPVTSVGWGWEATGPTDEGKSRDCTV